MHQDTYRKTGKTSEVMTTAFETALINLGVQTVTQGGAVVSVKRSLEFANKARHNRGAGSGRNQLRSAIQ